MVKIKSIIFLFILYTFVNVKISISYEEINHPIWIYKYQKYAYGHWSWFKEIPFNEWVNIISKKGANVIVVGQIPDKDNNYKWISKYTKIIHNKNMKFLIYVNFKRVSNIQKKNINFQALNWNNKRIPKFGNLCNIKYQKEILNLLKDKAKNYNFNGYIIDAFFFDVPYGSKAPECISLFKEKYGYSSSPNKEDIKKITPKFIDWINFHSNLRKEFLAKLTRELHKINPNFAVIVNQTCGWKFDIAYNQFLPMGIENFVDGIMEEGNWEYKSKRELPNRTIVKYIFQNKLLFNRKKVITLFWYLTYPQPFDEFKYKTVNTLMHGNIPVFTTGANLNIIDFMWKEIDKNKKIVLNPKIKSNNPIAVVFSEKTLWHFNPIKEKNVYPYIFNIYGFIQMLLESKLPFDVITDKYLSNEDLSNYKVIILPNTAILSKKEKNKLLLFIKNGGLVISSFETGMFNKYNKKYNNDFYKDLINFVPQEKIYFQKIRWAFSKNLEKFFLNPKQIKYYLNWRQGRISPLNYFPILQKSFYLKIKGFSGNILNNAKIVNGFVGNLNKKNIEKLPIFIYRKSGKGYSVYFPYDIGNIYFQNNFPPIDNLIKSIIFKFSSIGKKSKYKFDNFPVEVNKIKIKNKSYDIFINHNVSWSFGDSPDSFGYNYIKRINPSKNIKLYKVEFIGNN